jgi:hypothetical protein
MIPPRLSWQPDAITLEHSALMAIYCGRHNKTHAGLHLNYPTFLPGFNQILSFSTDVHAVLNTKFHTNASGGSCADTWGKTDSRTQWRSVGHKDGQTNMEKLTSVFRNYANTPKTIKISRTTCHVVVRTCPYARQVHEWKWRCSSTHSCPWMVRFMYQLLYSRGKWTGYSMKWILGELTNRVLGLYRSICGIEPTPS